MASVCFFCLLNLNLLFVVAAIVSSKMLELQNWSKAQKKVCFLLECSCYSDMLFILLLIWKLMTYFIFVE